MTRQGFYYDQTRCVGCKTCQISCKDVNGLALGKLFRRVASYETGSFPTPSTFHFAATCNHCAKPACVAVCPVSSMYKDKADGTVQHDDLLCIGCQYCVKACPYGNPKYLEDIMVVHKCDACLQLRQAGEQPACVAGCPARALEFGPFDELLALHPDAVFDLPLLPDSKATEPSLLIKARHSALAGEYREMLT
ncbi:MAG: 4Fe-4S dicluster domain-containing protein [Coriobacteriaceae bacterium]|nr:4Fe-4S dicluster domain-containing protein [Coriobacteriaceae bacterium]